MSGKDSSVNPLTGVSSRKTKHMENKAETLNIQQRQKHSAHEPAPCGEIGGVRQAPVATGVHKSVSTHPDSPASTCLRSACAVMFFWMLF